jgi:hypothetical protein
MNRNPMIDAGEKLVKSIQAALVAMDEVTYQMDIHKTYLLRAMNTEGKNIDEILAAGEATKEELIEVINLSLFGIAAILTAMPRLQDKAEAVRRMSLDLSVTLGEANDVIGEMAEPLYIEACMKEYDLTEEEARALLQEPLSEEELNKLQADLQL